MTAEQGGAQSPERSALDGVAQPEEKAEGDTPRIYVASLSDYNAGRLHGDWLDATGDLDALMEGVKGMLARSPAPGAEEWAIHDYDGFGGLRLSEFEPLSLVTAVASGIREYGGAFAAWADVVEKDPERLKEFEEGYQGTWDSLAAYAEDFLDDLGVESQLEAVTPEWLQPYVTIDYEAFGSDMELSGDIVTSRAEQGGIYVFWNV